MHETPLRSVMKGISWQGLGLLSTMLISYGFTGALFKSLGMAITLSGISLIVYVLHERIWQKLPFGRQYQKIDTQKAGTNTLKENNL